MASVMCSAPLSQTRLRYWRPPVWPMYTRWSRKHQSTYIQQPSVKTEKSPNRFVCILRASAAVHSCRRLFTRSHEQRILLQFGSFG